MGKRGGKLEGGEVGLYVSGYGRGYVSGGRRG